MIILYYGTMAKDMSKKDYDYAVVGHAGNMLHMKKIFQKMSSELLRKHPEVKFLKALFANEKLLIKVFGWLPFSFKANEIRGPVCKDGTELRGIFITYPIIPGATQVSQKRKMVKLISACRVAEKHRVKIMGLGGFSSIDDGDQGAVLAKYSRVALTNGNALTAVAALEGIYKVAGLLGVDLKRSQTAVIGATGDIGSACARGLSKKVMALILTARNIDRLERFAKTLSHNSARVFITTNNILAIKGSDIIITAASGITTLVSANDFKKGAIICDVGFPKNVSYEYSKRRDIFVFSGGLVKPPSPVKFGLDLGLPPGIIYGCFAEAIVLALEKRFEHFSIGRGNITEEKMEYIRQKALKHGFVLTPLCRGRVLINEERMHRLRR